MIVIPNLFGAYQKGREEAIKANWDDLSNYEDIESKRTRNDLDALTLLGKQADFAYDRENSRFIYNANQRKDELGQLGHIGDLYLTGGNNILAAASYEVLNDRNQAGEVYGFLNTNYGTAYDTAQASRANANTNLMGARITNQALAANFDYALKSAIQLKESEIGRALTSAEIATLRNDITLAYNRGYGSDLSQHTNAGRNAANAAAINSRTAVVTADTGLKAAEYVQEQQPRNQRITEANQVGEVLNKLMTAQVQNDPTGVAYWSGVYKDLTGRDYIPQSPAVATGAGGQALFGGGGQQVGVNTVLAQTTGSYPNAIPQVASAKNTQVSTPQVQTSTPQTQSGATAQGATHTYTPNGAPLFHPSLAGKHIGNGVYYNTPAMYSSPVGRRAIINPTGQWGAVGYGYPRQ